MRADKSIFRIRFWLSALLGGCFLFLWAGVSFSADLTLAWDANAENDIEGYKISYLTASPDGWIDGTGLDQGASPITVPLDGLKTAASPSFELSGLEAGESYHFAVTAYSKNGIESDFSNMIKHDVSERATFHITASTSGGGGISPEGTVTAAEGSSKTYVITAWEGHRVTDVIVDGNSMGPISAYTFDDIQSHHSIQAFFSSNTYSVFSQPEGTSALTPIMSLEIGEVNVNSNWQRVTFSRPFVHPVVVASSLSNNDDEPAVVRIDNITSTGFEIAVQEWDYLDDNHLDETIGYLVMEAGSHTLPDGTLVEAGTFSAEGMPAFTSVVFAEQFSHVPVVVSSVASYNGQDAAAPKLQNITTTGFEIRIQEQQASTWNHPFETISYIAWEPCRTQLDDLLIEVARTDDMMTHDFKAITFDTLFPAQPVFIAAIQTNDGGDTAALRWEERDTSSIQVKVEEEQSWDLETKHTSEVVGYFTFASTITGNAY